MAKISKIKLGILGCGKVAESYHIPAALSASNVELVGIVDSNPERLAYIKRSFGLSCFAATSHRDLIGKVDAILLLLSNHLHHPVGCEFLNESVHVLCEKPLATMTREAKLLCELAEARGVVLAVGYMKRFEPNFDLMKRLIDDAFLGKLHHFEFEYGTPGGWAPLSGYNLHREQAGGGVLMVNGTHFLDRMLCWFGYPSSVRFSDDSHGGVEANCLALFTFDSGLTGQVTLSKTHSLRNRFRLFGKLGCIEIADSQRGSVTFFPAHKTGLKHEISASPGTGQLSEIDYFRLQIEDFAHAIQSGTRRHATGRQGMACVSLMEECYKARTQLPQSWALDAFPKSPSSQELDSCSTLERDSSFQSESFSRSQPRFGSTSNDGSVGNDTVTMSRRKKTNRGGTVVQAENGVLITGSTGLVGSRLCEVLHLTTEYQPLPFVHSSGKGSYIARYPLDFRMGDVTDLSSIRRSMEGCSSVVHLARGSNRVMLNGLENVLRAAVGARVRRFIHVSSVAVYGDNPSPAARYEAAPLSKTGNDYGDIKIEQEKLVTSYGKRFGLPFVILRPPHIYGPCSHFVTALTQKIRAGLLPIVEGGSNVCNLVYIDNLIEAILLALDRSQAVGETFFITDKERVTWRKCLDDFAAILNVEIPHATAGQLYVPSTPNSRESLHRISRILLSSEFRSAVMELPAIGAVGRILHDRFEALTEKQRNYLWSRLRPSSIPHCQQSGPPRYDGTDYLIVAQRRKVVHACDKAEKILGYTASIGYSKALAKTRNWMQFAGMISKVTSGQDDELDPVRQSTK